MEKKKIISNKYLLLAVLILSAVLIIFVIILGISQAVGIKNQIKEGRYIGEVEYKNSITISGEGKVLAKPDIGQIILSVLVENKNVVVAQKENIEKMDKVIEAVKGLGVDAKDIKTVNYSIQPSYKYSSGRSEIIGYEVLQSLEVKIRNLDKTGEILEKAALLGANQVGSLNFTFDDPEKLQDEARQKAIVNAKKKAEALVNQMDVKLGKVVSFSENSPDQNPIFYTTDMMGRGGSSENIAPQIETGQNEIVVSVQIGYEIY